MEANLEATWKAVLENEFSKPYWQALSEFVETAYRTSTVYPPREQLFRAFSLCPFPLTRVVIVGQDPYHGEGQAHGLCFSVNTTVKTPPSLKNIFKELTNDLGHRVDQRGDLSTWATDGVLLLNAILTVEAHQAGSHQARGWEQFTDAVISALSDHKEHCVFLLWGNYARAKGARIDRTKHLVLESAHPSPLSARHGFFGSRQFSQTNAYLSEHHQKPISW